MENFDPYKNLARLTELSNEAVPFITTLEYTEENLDEIKFKFCKGSGVGIGIFKEEVTAILKAVITKGSIHQSHFHNEKEIFIILSGQIELTSDTIISYLKKGDMFILEPEVPHTVSYLEDTEMLVITIPASEDFPNARKTTK